MSFRAAIVALPVGVKPIISVKSLFQAKCSFQFCERELNKFTVVSLTESNAFVFAALCELQPKQA
ncbi:MAG: hypothetical protein LH614_10505 [Pyrinomonadaceae bacterium]|nr:hypothetical protein [Pyrinomonadaceae bacterium]